MTLRRLALTLALLTAPAQADDIDDSMRLHVREPSPLSTSAAWGYGAGAYLDDLLLRFDGSIAAVVAHGTDTVARIPWGLVRLVLADVEEGAAPDDAPVWVAAPPSRRALAERIFVDGSMGIALGGLGGSAVVDATGTAIGVVRGALVSFSSGSVLALALDVGTYLEGESRTIAVPWSWLSITDDPSAPVLLKGESDLRWLRYAPRVELTHLFE